jgi:hypothetical protein
MTKKIYFLLISLIFGLISFFHFLRLALEWKIIIYNWVLPSWASGLIVIFGLFILYWSLSLRKTKDEIRNKVEERGINE